MMLSPSFRTLLIACGVKTLVMAAWMPLSNSCVALFLGPTIPAAGSDGNPFGLVLCDYFPAPLQRATKFMVQAGLL